MTSMLNRVRARMFYLPTRTQGIIVNTVTIVVVAGAIVLSNVLTGTAREVYWAITFILLGASAVLFLQQRRR
jgi:hypothetical protein